MSVAEQMMEAQDRMLSGIEAAQTRMIEMNQRMAEAMSGLVPSSDKFQMPTVPGMDDMPKPAELIDRYFDFAGKLAEANRTFYKEMVSVWAPKEEAKPAAKPAAKSAAKSTK